MSWFADQQQHQVMRLEPSRAASAIGALLAALATGTASTGAFAIAFDTWPDGLREPDLLATDQELYVGGSVLGVTACCCLVVGTYHLRRRRLARRIIRTSDPPAFGTLTRTHRTVIATTRAS